MTPAAATKLNPNFPTFCCSTPRLKIPKIPLKIGRTCDKYCQVSTSTDKYTGTKRWPLHRSTKRPPFRGSIGNTKHASRVRWSIYNPLPCSKVLDYLYEYFPGYYPTKQNRTQQYAAVHNSTQQYTTVLVHGYSLQAPTLCQDSSLTC